MAVIELTGPKEVIVDEPLQGIVELTPAIDAEPIDETIGAEVADVEEEPKGFLDRFGEDFDKRSIETVRILERNARAEQTSVESFVQLAGNTVAGTTLDFIGQGLVSAFRALPDGLENPIRENAAKLLSTEKGKEGLEALTKGVQQYEAFAEENPRAAMNIESVANVALLAVPVKGGGAAKGVEQGAKQTGRLGKIAQTIEGAATKQADAAKRAIVQNLITPKQTAAVRASQVGRETEKGILQTVVTEPTAAEARMITEVAKLPGIKKGNTLRRSHKIIQDANRAEAVALKNALKANEIIFPRKEFAARLSNTIKQLDKNPLLVGDAKKSALKVANKMKSILLENKSTGSGLLKARKELDTWIKNQKGDSIFDPAKESALSIAVRDIRTTTNQFLIEKATGAPVKASLSKQAALFNAMENIAPKAAEEGRNLVKRSIARLTDALPVTAGLKQSLAAAGLVAAPLTFAPTETIALVGTGLAARSASRAIRSPASKRALAKLVHHADKAIASGRLGPKALIDMRADRAALVELMGAVGNDDE